MPSNQAMASGSQSCAIGSPKSNLVRSKSLRLPTTKPKTELSSNTLSRHGSMRQPRSQPSNVSSSRSQFSVFRKPAVKPKPAFCSSKSSENLENASSKSARSTEHDNKKASVSNRSPIKHVDSKGVGFSDLQPTPSDSPTSLHSDRSQSQDQNSWCNTDLVSHLKRLTEEHEKLQVEYARLRMQLVENSSFHPLSQLRYDQHLSRSDSHLASIPENSPDGNSSHSETQIQTTQETLILNYRSEIFRLQEENRKIQRKYWEQILNSELIVDEPCNGASQQVVDLIDKLDDKEKELLEANGRVQELENHLATTSLELHQCQDALQDQQRMLDEAITQRDELTKQLRECRSALAEAKENIDFLQIERSTLAEAFQETEQSLSETKAEMLKDQVKLKELMDRARRLYAKVNDKNLQLQLLHAELDRTQGNCRDMLLSQGAELTMISMHLSQMSMGIHTLLTSAAEFAANELSLQKEMLEDVMVDFDSEGDKSDTSPKPNSILSSDSHIPNSVARAQGNCLSSDKNIEAHKSLPDISTYEPVSPLYSSSSSGNDRPISFVQSMVRNYEQSAKNDLKSFKVTLKTSEHSLDSVKSSVENLSSINGDLSHISSPSKDNSPCTNSSAFKPIGMATAFFPIRHHSIETDNPSQHLNHEEKKTSFETQLNQMEHLIKKLGKVVELMQEKFVSKLKQLNDEKNALQEKLTSAKNKQYQLQTELNIKNFEIEKANEKVEEILGELNKAREDHTEEKEKLLQKNCNLNEKISCLEAVNAELSQQIKNEIQNMMSVVVTEHDCEFLSNAQAICDKLNYKKEIASLKATITGKEQLLQQLAQKYSRTTATLEKNLQRAEKEISVLDNVIGEVLVMLQSNPDLVESHDVLKKVLSLVSGNSTSSDIEKIVNSAS